MKLPEPVAHQYQNREGDWCDFINTKHYMDTATDGTWPIRAVYSEAQVKELLAQADKDFSDGMSVVHLQVADQMKKRYEPVLKQALDAMISHFDFGPNGGKKIQAAVEAIQKGAGMTEQEKNQMMRERLDAMPIAPPLANAVMIHADWITHMEAEIAKRDAVLKQALDALWTTATPKCEDAIKAIRKALG